MCQRRQKSAMFSALYGALKFFGNRTPRRARNRSRCRCTRKSRSRSEGVADHGGVTLERRVLERRVEHAIDEVYREVVADGDFLHEPDRNQKQRFAAFGRIEARGAGELRQEVARADDGTGDEMREKCDEREVFEVARVRLDVAAVHIHHVTHRLEREEADADGKRHAQGHVGRMKAERGERCLRALDAEVEVLEDREHTEIQDHRRDEPELSA